MDSKYTPGPWTEPRVYTNPDGSAYRVTVYGASPRLLEKTRTVSTVANPDAEDIANAQLVAAAPDLYEAAREVYLDCIQPSRWFEDNTFHRKQEHLNQLKAAIAKAEGRG